MEKIQFNSSSDNSVSPYKQNNIRNPSKSSVALISWSYENFAPSINHGGLLYPPHRSLSYSYPPFSTIRTQQQQQQPPLLPLPIANPYNNYNTRNQGLSCPPVNRKINNRSKQKSLTQKKTKPSITSPKKDESKKDHCKVITKVSSDGLIIKQANRLGPDPKDLPKVVSRVLSSSPSGNFNNIKIRNGMSDNSFTPPEDSVMFTFSPPPSSLPLPTFSLRPKLSCKAEAAAAEIDAGATDNLRRILRL